MMASNPTTNIRIILLQNRTPIMFPFHPRFNLNNNRISLKIIRSIRINSNTITIITMTLSWSSNHQWSKRHRSNLNRQCINRRSLRSNRNLKCKFMAIRRKKNSLITLLRNKSQSSKYPSSNNLKHRNFPNNSKMNSYTYNNSNMNSNTFNNNSCFNNSSNNNINNSNNNNRSTFYRIEKITIR